jgi:ribosome-associated protein
MKTSDLKTQVAIAINACEDKKAENIAILQLEKGAFTDYLVLASGTNPRQVQAIADEVEFQLKQNGVYPNSIEGYKLAEWVLLDYVDYVIQLFVAERRSHYDLDRLWRHAKRMELNDLKGKVSRARTTPATAAAATAGGKRKQVKAKRTLAITAAVRAASGTARSSRSSKTRTKAAKKKTARPRKKK